MGAAHAADVEMGVDADKGSHLAIADGLMLPPLSKNSRTSASLHRDIVSYTTGMSSAMHLRATGSWSHTTVAVGHTANATYSN